MKTRRGYLLVSFFAFSYLSVQLFRNLVDARYAPELGWYGLGGTFFGAVALLALYGAWRNELELKGVVGPALGWLAALETLVWTAIGTGLILMFCVYLGLYALVLGIDLPFWKLLWVVPVAAAGLLAGLHCYLLAGRAIGRISGDQR